MHHGSASQEATVSLINGAASRAPQCIHKYTRACIIHALLMNPQPAVHHAAPPGCSSVLNACTSGVCACACTCNECPPVYGCQHVVVIDAAARCQQCQCVQVHAGFQRGSHGRGKQARCLQSICPNVHTPCTHTCPHISASGWKIS